MKRKRETQGERREQVLAAARVFAARGASFTGG
jgi:hypothetical protein